MDYSHYATKFLTDSIADLERMEEPMNNICRRESGGTEPFYSAIGDPMLGIRDRVRQGLADMRAELANRGPIKWDTNNEEAARTALGTEGTRHWFNVFKSSDDWVAFNLYECLGYFPTKWEAMAACEVRNRYNEGK